jgi:TatD DNase family protein
MVFIDVHCHLDFYEDEKIDGIVKRAKKAGVGIAVNNGVNPAANQRILKLAMKYPEIKVALGLYPIDALKMSEKEIGAELEFIRKNTGGIVAIGEVGMDFKESEEKERQGEIFRKVIDLAIEIDKPLIVHSRKAEKEVIEMLEKAGAKKVIMHCFCGNFKLVAKIVENGWSITVPTSVKNSEHFQKIIAEVPLGNLLCETDSPFLHPDKERWNEPMNVIVSYKKIAEIKGISLGEVEKKIEGNFDRLFVNWVE